MKHISVCLQTVIWLVSCWGMTAIAEDFLPDESTRQIDEWCLVQSYPERVDHLEKEGDHIWLVLKDGNRVMYADTATPVLDMDGVPVDATVSQSMSILYHPGSERTAPKSNPGRVRSHAFLNALYGVPGKELPLTTVKVDSSPVRVNTQQGMAEAFRRVAAGLEQLIATDPALRSYLFPIGGQFRRAIAGTSRLSPHSYGIAIDLNPQRAPYWRWNHNYPHPAQFSYPESIVSLFEANGFIWGGKWHEYDIMHFEYRPELLCKSRILKKNP